MQGHSILRCQLALKKLPRRDVENETNASRAETSFGWCCESVRSFNAGGIRSRRAPKFRKARAFLRSGSPSAPPVLARGLPLERGDPMRVLAVLQADPSANSGTQLGRL
ncbi:hypothetical protein AKJ09_07417 [Labilithrix luteola]|uniref:Uncharacterized protein n=1 Tax=Labilithrix luteola TaxID=1391654 RepID=A0A0K1Q4W7_9BACT|nr:hypothetical protein AKJ09_07417 [Labilithrix luteola]